MCSDPEERQREGTSIVARVNRRYLPDGVGRRRCTSALAWALAIAQLAAASPGVAARPDRPVQDPTLCASCGPAKTALSDAREVVLAPVHWRESGRRRVAIEAAAIVGSILWLDGPVRERVQNDTSDTTDRIARTFEPFGAEYALGTLAGFALLGKIGDNSTARNVAFDGAVSVLLAGGVVAPVLKSITGRSRPDTGQGAHDFEPFDGADSFPSGHTAIAFALATSVARNYERPWIKGLSYGVAGLVAYARMEHDVHWLSDVAAGTSIGIGVGRAVAARHRARRGLMLEPARVADGLGLRIEKAF